MGKCLRVMGNVNEKPNEGLGLNGLSYEPAAISFEVIPVAFQRMP